MINRSVLSPLSKTSKVYLEPHELPIRFRDTYHIFGDNDLDFSLLLLSKRGTANAIVTSQNNLYFNFWDTLSRIGVEEFSSFFISQMSLYIGMPHDSLLNEMAHLGTAGSLVAFFLLTNVTKDGTPFGAPRDTAKEKITLSLLRLKNIQPLLKRIKFEKASEHNGIYLCMNEIERGFSNRDEDTLSFKIEEIPSLNDNLVLSNLSFERSTQRIDKYGNFYYLNA